MRDFRDGFHQYLSEERALYCSRKGAAMHNLNLSYTQTIHMLTFSSLLAVPLSGEKLERLSQKKWLPSFWL